MLWMTAGQPSMPVSKRRNSEGVVENFGWLRLVREVELGSKGYPRVSGVSLRAGQLTVGRSCTSAGASVVVHILHKLSARQQAWEDMKSTNPVLRKFSKSKQAYNESEDSLVSGLRTVTDTINSWFDEDKTAQVLRARTRRLLIQVNASFQIGHQRHRVSTSPS